MMTKEQKRAYFRRWYAANKERVLAKVKAWAENNKERVKETKRRSGQKNNWKKAAYMAKRRAQFPDVRLLDALRGRLRSALRRKKAVRSARTLDLIGCDLQSLKKHLESQFQPGMSWENIREWEVDHIRPCCQFDLTNPQHQRECFHFSNLQPLWQVDNRVKSAKDRDFNLRKRAA